jgi:hypothetical protein
LIVQADKAASARRTPEYAIRTEIIGKKESVIQEKIERIRVYTLRRPLGVCKIT